MSQSPSGLSRRTLFAGAGTLAAVATAASLGTSRQAIPDTQPPESKPAPERGGGYSLSEHVKHYYRTARI